MGASAYVPELRCDAVLRRLTKPPREPTCARERTSGHCVGGTRRALAILLSRRRLRGILTPSIFYQGPGQNGTQYESIHHRTSSCYCDCERSAAQLGFLCRASWTAFR